jgi:plasmid stabilization system protein ParE
MKIVWTEPAVKDLRELHSYIARDSEMYASGFVERIILAAERLVSHPKLGRVVSETDMKMFASFSFNGIVLFIASRRIVLK